MTNYRVIIAFSPERKVFVASAPELEGCEAEGESRAAATARLEEEIAAQLGNIEEQGAQPPVPIDEAEFNGQLNLKVSSALHRDLVFMARAEKVELEVLLAELLTRGVEGRSSGRARQPRTERGEEGRGRPREGQGQRYHDIMENRADFIEYVRSLDGGGRGGRGGGGGRGRRGR